jgi:hypothetical protein
MHIRRGFSITFDEQAYLDFHGERFARLLRHPDRRAAFNEAMAEIHELIAPAACWDRFPVQAIEGSRVGLANGQTLNGDGVLGKFVERATEIGILICTIGPQVDEQIMAHQRGDQMFKGMLLHELAAWAVDMVCQEALKEITDEVKAQGLHSGAPISPGQSGWMVQDQSVLFALVDAAQIDVSLSRTCVMYPVKSLSMVIGIGPEPVGPAVDGKVPCDFCSLSDRCQYSRAGRGEPSML